MAYIGTGYIRIAPNMSGIQGKIASGLKGTGSQFANQFGGEISGRSAAVAGAIAGIAGAATSKALGMISNSVGDAIKRVDTLNSSGKTFEYMGFSAEEASKATGALEKSITGLPTPLDSAMRGMTSLAATYGDIDLGQKVFSSLNNAILGFGGSAAQVENAVTQISQLPLDGPLDAQTWNSLRNSGLTPVLAAMAKDSGMSLAKMKEAFGKGELTVQDFTDKLTTMNTKGGGGLESLEKIAKNATGGIGTGIANMQTAITRGMANIIQSIGAEKISNAIAAIGKAFEKVLSFVADAIPKIVDTIAGFVEFVVRNKDVFAPLAAGAAAAVAAILGLMIAAKVGAAITAVTNAVKAAKLAMFTFKVATAQGATAMQAFNIATGANPLAIIIVALAAVTAALVYFFTKTETGQKIFQTVWGKIKGAIDVVVTAFGTVKDAVTGFISGAVDKLSAAVEKSIEFIKDWRHWFKNIGIVITAVLLPKLAQLAGRMVATAAKAVAEAARAAGAWVAGAARAVGAWLRDLPKMIAQFAHTAASAVASGAKMAGSFVAAAAKTIASWATTFAKYVAGVAMMVAKTVAAGLRMAASWLMALGPIGLIVAAVVGAVALIIANWDKVKAAASAVWNAIKSAVSSAFNWIKNAASSAWNAIKSGVAAVGNFFKTVWDKISTAARSAIDKAVEFFTGLPGRIVRAIGNLGSTLLGAGKDLIQGLLDGAGSLLKDIGKFFLDKLPGWIQKPFKKALGIESPSKVFMQFGKYIGAGLIKGLQGSQAAVSKQAQKLADKAISSTRAALKKMRQDQAALVSNIAGSLKQATGLLAVKGTNDPTSFVTGLQQQLAAVKKFRSDLELLRKRGLSGAQIAEIAGAGLEQGGALAASLSNLHPTTLKELNSLQKQINTSTNQVGKVAGNAMYKAGIDTLSGLVRGMLSQRSAVIRLVERLGVDMTKALKKKLGIKSPSKVFAEFGKNIDQGLAAGITKGTSIVAESINNMADKAISGMVRSDATPTIAASLVPSAVAAGSTTPSQTTQTVTIQNVNLGDASAVKEFFAQLNQDTINVGMGMTPIQGSRP